MSGSGSRLDQHLAFVPLNKIDEQRKTYPTPLFVRLQVHQLFRDGTVCSSLRVESGEFGEEWDSACLRVVRLGRYGRAGTCRVP